MHFGFLLDMDGVIYRGSEPIPGAVEFVNHLTAAGIPFLFLTNNSQRTTKDIVTRLRRMGLKVQERHIFTSAIATAEYLSHQQPQATAFVIGEGGLLNALHEHGFSVVDHDPDFVVIGEGRSFTLEAVESAVRHVNAGAMLIATNMDPHCPTANGIRPGCGAFVKLIETATGRTAFSPGKPNPVMFRSARKRLGLRTAQTIMIGDTMETDILGGLQMGYYTVLVLSGGTRIEDLARYSYKPNLVVNSVAELLENSEFVQHMVLQRTEFSESEEPQSKSTKALNAASQMHLT